jgi:hypothetical protein
VSAAQRGALVARRRAVYDVCGKTMGGMRFSKCGRDSAAQIGEEAIAVRRDGGEAA